MSELSKEYWEELNTTQEQLTEHINKDPWRLAFHVMPETGWLNDPNGLVHFKGTYHIYHQYVPDNPGGGLVHWGHKTSKDLVHFKEEEIFLSPDKPYDKDGVYSGSAFVKDDEIHFFYTGNVKESGEHDYTFSGREQNTVHVVSKDGFTVDYREVCIAHADYPEGFTDHIRDPKVFEKNGQYYMVLGSRALDHHGKVLVYVSEDLYNWTYKGVFLEGDREMGYMYECPDFFETPTKDMLIFSPQGLKATQHEFENVYQAGYYLGQTDWEKASFIPETDFKELDRGFDFYAPQTFEDESGRRILFAWMGIGDTMPEYSNPTAWRGWQHALTLPRELTVENGELRQRPLKEYESLRQNEVSEKLTSPGKITIKQDTTFEMHVEVEERKEALAIYMKEDTVLRYEEGILSLNHGVSGYGRSTRSIQVDELKSVHLFVDTSSIEVFVNDGEYVMTSRVYPKNLRETLVVEAEGQLKVTKWELIK